LHEQVPDLPDCDPATVAAWVLAQARNVLPAVDRVDLFDSHGAGSIACAHDVLPPPGL
jgi:6-pyruvoyltetrahydropterin/6-carboxytetrahydropterin synthase